MPSALSKSLLETVGRELPSLSRMTDSAASLRPAGTSSWSPREELGHLIDSAANNHIRFAQAAIARQFSGASYPQNDWVAIHGYGEMPWLEIVEFWAMYNRFLAALIARIPEDAMSSPCVIYSGSNSGSDSGSGSVSPVTLEFLIDDYILHLRHHMDHLLGSQNITAYPR